MKRQKNQEPAVMDSEDSQTISLHALAWISGTPEGTSLSVSPEKNTLTSASYQIDFSKGGGEDIPAGQIEIRIPAHIFFGRDGKAVDTPIVPLAKAPAEEGDTGFNYSIDEATGEIVIRNYRIIEASYHFVCQVGYDFIPMQVANGYKKKISHYVLVKYPRIMLETTTNITNTCTANINGYDGDNHSKSANGTYTYVAPDIIYKGDYCRTDKGGGMDIIGGVNLLKSGRSIKNYFSVNVTVQGYGMTNNGADAYTTVLEDDLLFLDETRLIEGDYTLTSFYLTGLSEYGYSIDPENGYQPVLDSNYVRMPPSPSGLRRRLHRING